MYKGRSLDTQSFVNQGHTVEPKKTNEIRLDSTLLTRKKIALSLSVYSLVFLVLECQSILRDKKNEANRGHQVKTERKDRQKQERGGIGDGSARDRSDGYPNDGTDTNNHHEDKQTGLS